MTDRIKNTYKTIQYEYKNVPIPGGGFVTGFVFHPAHKDILYARTDIGGCYRFDFTTKKWCSLSDAVTDLDLMETFPLSIAVDKNNPDSFYFACGDGENGRLCVSLDRGETFAKHEIPSQIHGNHPGRGTGERLCVDENNPKVIYFGSMKQGLLRSINGGMTWDKLKVGEINEKEITFVYVNPSYTITDSIKRSRYILVGTTGEMNQKTSTKRGASLYLSIDGGNQFKPMPWPDSWDTNNSAIKGLVGVRCEFDGTYYYVNTIATGENAPFGFSSYACDSNHPSGGKVLRYLLDEEGNVEEFKDITPSQLVSKSSGFGGITTHKEIPGLVVCSTIGNNSGEMILMSKDYGLSWEVNLKGLTTGRIEFTVPYMKPEYNGNSSLIHWLSDIKINPFNPNHAVFNTGTGVFMTFNLLDENCLWTSQTDGIEETVHLNIYSPPTGNVKLLDILGDLGGFAFTDVNKPAENTFADAEGNRYITCCNGDFSDMNSNHVVATPRGNWTGKTLGGVIYSTDQCKSFKLLNHPFGISSFIDSLIHDIRKPNVNSGWAAISPDCKTILWSIAKRIALPANAVVYTKDGGVTWKRTKVYDITGAELQDENIIPPEPENLKKGGWKAYKEFLGNIIGLKVFADRVNSNVFYGFGDHSKMYVSLDGGMTFYQHKTPNEFPVMNLAGIDGGNLAEIRVESGKEGVIWIATGEEGLFKLIFDRKTGVFTTRRITKPGDYIRCQGMGKGYGSERGEDICKTLYVSGMIDGTYGFWRSMDEGDTWERINTVRQMYGQIRSITGDPRVFGRIYIGTGSRGVLYGEPIQ